MNKNVQRIVQAYLQSSARASCDIYSLFFPLLLLLLLLLKCICERRIQYQSDNYRSVQYTAFHLIVRHTCIVRISFEAYVARALTVRTLVIVAVIMIIFIEALFFFFFT